MSYFVTGATGFVGRNLVRKLLQRKGTIYCLVRRDSMAKFKALRDELDASDARLVAVVGDIGTANLGVAAQAARDLSGNVRHFFHLAALYDLTDFSCHRHTSDHAWHTSGTRMRAIELFRLNLGG